MSERNPMTDVIKKVEDFIEAIHSGELEISDAKAIKVPSAVDPELEGDLASNLGEAMNQYEKSKLESSEKQKQAALACISQINQAYTHNVIKAGQRLYSKVWERDSRITSLEQRITELEKEFNALDETHRKTLEDMAELQGRLNECRECIEKHLSVFKKGDQLSDEQLR